MDLLTMKVLNMVMVYVSISMDLPMRVNGYMVRDMVKGKSLKRMGPFSRDNFKTIIKKEWGHINWQMAPGLKLHGFMIRKKEEVMLSK